MNRVEIEQTRQYDELWGLLLMADPSKEIVSAYLNQSSVYVAKINGIIVGSYVLFRESSLEFEIKNIAVSPEYQKMGIGYQMLIHAQSVYQDVGGSKLKICTGNTSTHQIALYKKAGFCIESIVTGFFIENYIDPIYENGARCEDLVVMFHEASVVVR